MLNGPGRIENIREETASALDADSETRCSSGPFKSGSWTEGRVCQGGVFLNVFSATLRMHTTVRRFYVDRVCVVRHLGVALEAPREHSAISGDSNSPGNVGMSQHFGHKTVPHSARKMR